MSEKTLGIEHNEALKHEASQELKRLLDSLIRQGMSVDKAKELITSVLEKVSVPVSQTAEGSVVETPVAQPMIAESPQTDRDQVAKTAIEVEPPLPTPIPKEKPSVDQVYAEYTQIYDSLKKKWTGEIKAQDFATQINEGLQSVGISLNVSDRVGEQSLSDNLRDYVSSGDYTDREVVAELSFTDGEGVSRKTKIDAIFHKRKTGNTVTVGFSVSAFYLPQTDRLMTQPLPFFEIKKSARGEVTLQAFYFQSPAQRQNVEAELNKRYGIAA